MLKKNSILWIGIVLFAAVICYGTTNTPWDGTAWDVTAPDIDQPIGNHYKEMYDLRKGVAIRINKEHETLATSSAGGVHKQGSARAFWQDAAPTTQIDGSAWDSGDTGSFWFDTDSTPDNLFYVLTDSASTGTWTLISDLLSGEAFTWTSDHIWDDGTTDSPTLKLVDATDEEFALVKLDDGDTTATIPADTDFEIVTGNLAVGDGVPDKAAMDGEDVYIEGELEVDGAVYLDGVLTVGTIADGAVATTQSIGDDDTSLATTAFVGAVVGEDFRLVDVNGSPVKVYTKYFTGNLDADSQTNVSHGVAGGTSKILSITSSALDDNISYFKSSDIFTGASTAGAVKMGWDATFVYFIDVGTNLQGNAYRVKVDYIL